MRLGWQKTTCQPLLPRKDSGLSVRIPSKTFFTCSVTPGNFTVIMWSYSLTLSSAASSQKSCFSLWLWAGASPELPGASGLGEDGWRSDLAAVGRGGSRKQAPREVIHPNGIKEVGSGGDGGLPNRVMGRDAFPISAQISSSPLLLHSALF